MITSCCCRYQWKDTQTRRKKAKEYLTDFAAVTAIQHCHVTLCLVSKRVLLQNLSYENKPVRLIPYNTNGSRELVLTQRKKAARKMPGKQIQKIYIKGLTELEREQDHRTPRILSYWKEQYFFS